MVGSLLKKANLSTPHRPSTCAAILFVTSPRFGALKSWKVLVLSYSVTLCRMYTCCYDPRNALSDVNGFRSDKMLYLWSDLICFEQVWTQHNTLPWNISGSAESPNRYQPPPPHPFLFLFGRLPISVLNFCHHLSLPAEKALIAKYKLLLQYHFL